MRSLGFYLYLPKLSSIKVTVAFKIERQEVRGWKRNLAFLCFYQERLIMFF